MTTDVWFRSQLPLRELAEALGAPVQSADVENHWEWVIADLAGTPIDITRAHRTAPDRTDTRIFRPGSASEFPRETLDHLVTALQRIGIAPIYLGRWTYQRGNEFDRVVYAEI